MDIRKNHLVFIVACALLGATFSCTVFSDNLTRDNAAAVGHDQSAQFAGPGSPVPLDLSHVFGATNTLTHLYSGFGTPVSYQIMDGNGVHAFEFVNAGDEMTYIQFHWKIPHAWNQVARCEWHSSVSSKALVGWRFSVRVPTLISSTPSQTLVASSGSNSQEFSCSG